jgi:hypothetical protein
MVPCNTLYLCKSCIVKYLTGHMKNCNENYYPMDDIDIVGDDRSSTSKTCIISCGYDGWLQPKICTKEIKFTKCKQNAMHGQQAYMMNTCQELNISHFWNSFYLFYLISSHNHSITILSFINLLNSMECLLSYSIKTSESNTTTFLDSRP